LLVGRATNWTEAYGVIIEVEDYNLDKPVAAASLLNEVADIIEIAKQRGGPATMILVLETEQGSAVMGAIYEIEQYDLTRSQALRQAEGLD
jgi:hypothetical protein